MTIAFTPSPTDNATAYTLVTNDPGTVTPTTITAAQAAAGQDSFTVTGGTCGTNYTFEVDTSWTDNGTPSSTPVKSEQINSLTCTAPGAPSGISIQATSSGVRIGWSAPANTGDGTSPTYSVEWSGPDGTGTSKSGITGTSYTASADIDGAYNVTISAKNAVGSSPATGSQSVTGPAAGGYSMQNLGDTGDETFFCSTDTQCDSGSGLKTNESAGWSNGAGEDIICQEQGATSSHNGLSTNMYDKLSVDGVTGYVTGYLMTAPEDSYVGLPVWRCS